MGASVYIVRYCYSTEGRERPQWLGDSAWSTTAAAHERAKSLRAQRIAAGAHISVTVTELPLDRVPEDSAG